MGQGVGSRRQASLFLYTLEEGRARAMLDLSLATLSALTQGLLMCAGRGLGSQVPSTSSKNTLLHIHLDIPGGGADLPRSSVTR